MTPAEKQFAQTEIAGKPSSAISEYLTLMKPGIMLLLVLEAVTAMIVATGRAINFASLLGLLAAGILSSGGSASLNQYLERKTDALMGRTENRPLVKHAIKANDALIFGMALCIASLFVCAAFLNLVTALMVFLGIISYIFLYTLFLKPRTQWNIVIGGVAGVFPALAGWAAATGTVGIPAVFIGSLVFLWTPPHFWGLAMKYRKDYASSAYPMLPVLKSEGEVAKWIFTSSILLVLFSFLPLFAHGFLGEYGVPYYGACLILGGAFIAANISLLKRPSPENAFKIFLISLPYLLVIFAALIAESLVA